MLQPRQPLMIMTHHQNRAQSQQSNRKKERDRSSSRKDIDCPPFLPIGKFACHSFSYTSDVFDCTQDTIRHSPQKFVGVHLFLVDSAHLQ
eukprot:scaffold33047_cov19-Tisochrysis_lutea.AAC.1